jgi:tetratricopeptide (TPR) repeat protein
MIFTKRSALYVVLLLQLGACSTHPTAGQRGEASVTSEMASAATGAGLQNTHMVERKTVPKRIQQQFDKAVEAMRAAQWASATAILEPLVAEYADFSGPWLNLGIAYSELGELDKAKVAFAQAIAVNAHNLEAYNQLAAWERNAGDFSAAQTLYEQALVIDPNHAPTHLNLGVLYDIYMGEFARAASHYQTYQSLQAEPDRRVAGWLMDLQRRPLMVARSGSQP